MTLMFINLDELLKNVIHFQNVRNKNNGEVLFSGILLRIEDKLVI